MQVFVVDRSNDVTRSRLEIIHLPDATYAVLSTSSSSSATARHSTVPGGGVWTVQTTSGLPSMTLHPVHLSAGGLACSWQLVVDHATLCPKVRLMLTRIGPRRSCLIGRTVDPKHRVSSCIWRVPNQLPHPRLIIIFTNSVLYYDGVFGITLGSYAADSSRSVV